MELSPDTMLKDRYRIEGILGKGGMGAVYLAYDTSLETQVAVKTNLSPGEQSERQFLQEARLLASLRHDNMPRVTDYFVEGDVQYLVMDYVAGADLADKLENEGRQPLEYVLRWADKLGDAVSYLHSHSPPIVHRDIKPSNIKLTPEGEPMLVDFGIAKPTTGDTVTAMGARSYTPGYAPPEQYGATKMGAYSDQYALAATFYALLTGQPPPESVSLMLGEETLQTPRAVNPLIPKSIDAALMRGLALSPQDRFASVGDFVAALKNLEGAEVAQTTAARQPERQARGGSSIMLGIIGALVVVGILGVGGIFLLGSAGGGSNTAEVFPTATLEPQPPTEAAVVVPATPTPTETVEPTSTDTPTPAATDTATPEPTPLGSGGLIAFVSNRADGKFFQLYTMRPDGSDVTQLTFDLTQKSEPAWSPDGMKLLFVADGGTRFGTPMGLDIFVMDSDGGGEPLNLTESAGDDTNPAWSPDGKRIAFTSTRFVDQPNIFVMNADGSDPVNATFGYASEYGPSWSTDSQWLAFARSVSSAPAYIGLRRDDFSEPRFFDLSFREGQVGDVAWSPDGTLIAYTKIEEGRNEIYVAAFEERGGLITALTNTLGNSQAAWSPDSLWIVFTSTRDQNPEIYRMDRGGRNQTNLSNHPGVDREPAWKPLP